VAKPTFDYDKFKPKLRLLCGIDGKSVAAWLKELGNKKAKYKEVK
jgi:hypothetical protein